MRASIAKAATRVPAGTMAPPSLAAPKSGEAHAAARNGAGQVMGLAVGVTEVRRQ